MNISDLRVCLLVAQERHFGRAAVLAGVSQPAVSQALKRVEQIYEIRLFERGGRHVVVTAAGRRMLPLVEAIVDTADRLTEAAHPAPRSSAHHLRIGYTPWFRSQVRRLVSAVRGVDPSWQPDLVTGDIDELERGLADGRLDLACVPRGSQPTGWIARPAARVRLSAVAHVRGGGNPQVLFVPTLDGLLTRREATAAAELVGLRHVEVRAVACPEELIDRVLAGEGGSLADPDQLPAWFRDRVRLTRLPARAWECQFDFVARPELAGLLRSATATSTETASVAPSSGAEQRGRSQWVMPDALAAAASRTEATSSACA